LEGFTPEETLFSFPKDDLNERLTMERDFLLPSTTERRLRMNFAGFFDGEGDKF